jgi:hypothetical protein
MRLRPIPLVVALVAGCALRSARKEALWPPGVSRESNLATLKLAYPKIERVGVPFSFGSELVEAHSDYVSHETACGKSDRIGFVIRIEDHALLAFALFYPVSRFEEIQRCVDRQLGKDHRASQTTISWTRQQMLVELKRVEGVAVCEVRASFPRAKIPKLRLTTLPDLSKLAHRVLIELSALRGLTALSEPSISTLDQTASADLAQDTPTKAAVGQASRWVAFGSADPKSAREALTKVKAAAYCRRDGSIVLDGALKEVDDGLLLTLAHELEHFLQLEAFRRWDQDTFDYGDRQLAAAAAAEGDAVLAGFAYLAAYKNRPVSEMVSRADKFFQTLQWSAHLSSALEGAPPQLRNLILFPYVAGLHLARAVFKEGGFRGLDQLFTRPPRSTEQVLHPDKYLADEPPISVAVPKPPPGARVVESGTLGELQIASLLETCPAVPRLRWNAIGWGGDSYTISTRGGENLLLAWVTDWDFENAAVEFETSVRLCEPYWRDQANAPGTQWRIGKGTVIRRSGSRVVVLRGFESSAGEAAAESLLGAID